MKFSVIVLACVLAIAPSLAAPASSLPADASPSTVPEVSAAPEASAAPETPAALETAAPQLSAAPEVPIAAAAPEVPIAAAAPAVLEASAAPEAPTVLKVSAAPETPAALEASAAPEAPVVLKVSGAPAVLKASAAPKVEEKPAPVVLVSASSPSEATPILRSYVAPSEAFIPAPVAPVASFAPAPAFVNVPKYVANARDAQTIQYSNDISPNGAFNYFFETNNGIAAQAEGVPRSFYSGADEVSPVVEQGSFAWISPEGQEIFISYVADENGYQPTGNAIPVAPEIPPAILRSLEFIARSRSAVASTKNFIFFCDKNYKNLSRESKCLHTPVSSTQAPLCASVSASVVPAVAEVKAPVVSVVPAARVYPAAQVAPVAPVISVTPVAPVTPVYQQAKIALPTARWAGDARAAETLKNSNQINSDGAFQYAYETNNGIVAEEQGSSRSFYSGEVQVAPIIAQGSFGWTSPEGQQIIISYVADESGYHPTGSAIPEVPPQIARALAYIASRNLQA